MELNDLQSVGPSTSYVAESNGRQTAPKKTGKSDNSQLTEEQKSQIAELKKRDAEVRAHEQAHMAAGGQYVKGGATFSYQTGPDNKRYAIGGEVSIDTSPGKTPEETVQKMRAVKAAAMAPANPSGQDMAVAAQAAQAEAQAQSEKNQKVGNVEMASKNSGQKKSGPMITAGYSSSGKLLKTHQSSTHIALIA